MICIHIAVPDLLTILTHLNTRTGIDYLRKYQNETSTYIRNSYGLIQSR